MPDERARILELLQAGKITVEEAEQLLDALGKRRDEPSWEEGAAARERQRRLCVRITDLRTGKTKVNVRLPSGAWNLLSKLTKTRLGRHISGVGLYEIQRAVASGSSGAHIVDVTDEERGERVEIFLE
jgi:hypothetical protein